IRRAIGGARSPEASCSAPSPDAFGFSASFRLGKLAWLQPDRRWGPRAGELLFRTRLVRLIVTGVLVACCALPPQLHAKEKPAKLEVSGFGFFGDIDLKRTLRILTSGKKR